jgi:hypothetical protein
MGYIKHNALIIEVSYGAPVWDVYTEICRFVKDRMGANLVSPPIESAVNGDVFIFVAPDGSKQGWKTDEDGNKMRAELYDFVTSKYNGSIEVTDLQFGGDDYYYEITHYSQFNSEPMCSHGELD